MKYRRFSTLPAITLAMLFVVPGLALAEQAAAPTPSDAAAVQPAEQNAPVPPAANGEHITVTVELTHASNPDASLANIPVILQAARPRGPFETQAPAPALERTALTDATGVARFGDVPESVMRQGLRLHAVANYGGVTFSSAPATPSASMQIKLKLYERGLDPSGVTVSNLRMIVEPWEGYLVFTQFWTLSLEGNEALDVSLLADPQFEKGLPLRLPTRAQGIQASGPGESQVVNSIVYWNGVLVPGEPVTLQMRYSMSVKDSAFIYEQVMAYPTRNIEVIAPLQTQFRKVPRLDGLEMLAPGFQVESGAGVMGLPNNLEFLVARGLSVDAGESFRFQLRGLPFGRPLAPWIALGLGVAGGLFVFGYARYDRRRSGGKHARREALESLEAERDRLLDQLAELERAHRDDELDDDAFGIESILLRERIALLLKKARDLREAA